MTEGVNPTSRRGLARRLTVQALYQWLVNESAPESLLKEFREQPDGLGRADPEYFAELLNGTVQVKPRWTGKTATAFQMLALALAMLQINPFGKTFSLGSWTANVEFIDIAVVFAGLFTAISGVGYIVDGIRQIQDKGHGDPSRGRKSDPDD